MPWLPKPDPDRFALQAFLDAGCAGKSMQERLTLMVQAVLLTSPDPRPETIIVIARRWGISSDRAQRDLLSGYTLYIAWRPLEGTLRDCGATRAQIAIINDLHHDCPRHDPQPATLPPPPAPPADGQAGTEETAEDPHGTTSGDEPADASVPTGQHDDATGEEEPDEDPADEAGDEAGQDSPAPGSKPDPARASTVTDLLAMMDQYRRWKGKPSYRDMSAAIDHRYSAAHLGTVVKTPQRDPLPRLPKLRFVEAYIEGCGGDETEIELWRQAWRRIELTSAPEQRPDPTP